MILPISLRLLALILCSNCSNTFNKVLTSTWRHIVKLLFETSGHHFSLLNMFHGWSKHFTSRYDPSTPQTFTPHPNLQPNCKCWGIWGGGHLRAGGVGCGVGGPVQIACSGVKLNDFQPSSSPQRSRRYLIDQPFISQLSKHVSVYHHGCYWFLIWEDQIGNVL